MDHEIVLDQLELYHPEDPDPDLPDRETLQRELSDSPELRRRLDGILEADERIAAVISAVEVPTTLRDGVLERLRETSGPASTARARPVVGYVLAASGALVAASLLLILFWPSSLARDWSIENICLRAGELHVEIEGNLIANPSYTDFPSDHFSRRNVNECREKVDFLGSKARLYQLSGGGSVSALLIVIPKRDYRGSFEFGRIPDSSIAAQGFRLAIEVFSFGDFVCIAVADDRIDFDRLKKKKPGSMTLI